MDQGYRAPGKPKRNRFTDNKRLPSGDEIRRSIIEVRGIYKELTDEQFIEFYSRRYGVDRGGIRKTLGDMQP